MAMLADVPHILKNIRNALLNNGTIWLSPDILREADLVPESSANYNVIVRLYHFLQDQKKQGHLLTLAPHLTKEAIFPGPFAKMKVNLARSVMSKETAVAIRFVVQHYPEKFHKEDLTTAFFIESVDNWYNIMNNRKLSLAFSRKNPEAHAEVISYLVWFMSMYGSCKLHHKQQDDTLKPSQEGVLLSTSSILYLQEKLLNQGFDWVLSARFSNDGIENYHSVVRSKDKAPTPLKFKR